MTLSSAMFETSMWVKSTHRKKIHVWKPEK